ncbi:hypothetical protein [Methanimicrococcus hongohii]|uniref:hypothetical protein n=1 Tax=Methanimicrococcus hongohii TaxID=3028295 RepID=UPI00292DA8A6|nr:hypothetical protein [Methanimicrococcus sp. Hf6]
MHLFFFSNPFAFANVPLLPSGFCFRCCQQVSVSAWSQVSASAWSQVSVSAWSQISVSAWSQVSVSAWSQVSVSAADQVCISAAPPARLLPGSRAVRARAAPLFQKKLKIALHFS